jgi:hypothetical protein
VPVWGEPQERKTYKVDCYSIVQCPYSAKIIVFLKFGQTHPLAPPMAPSVLDRTHESVRGDEGVVPAATLASGSVPLLGWGLTWCTLGPPCEGRAPALGQAGTLEALEFFMFDVDRVFARW